jgi:hypothetical protein
MTIVMTIATPKVTTTNDLTGLRLITSSCSTPLEIWESQIIMPDNGLQAQVLSLCFYCPGTALLIVRRQSTPFLKPKCFLRAYIIRRTSIAQQMNDAEGIASICESIRCITPEYPSSADNYGHSDQLTSKLVSH